jgi:hypothetical protein
MNTEETKRTSTLPDQLPLTKSQAKRLSGLTGINAKEFVGHSVSELAATHRFLIDPELFLFRRICGKVVKKDPVTGVEYPVPFANVYAEDTECSILGLFPERVPFAWFFPFWCHTEVVAHTVTDACGNFCFWVPRFEIEWILRFRLERRCYLQQFTKPTIGNIVAYLQGPHPIGPDPGPEAVALKPGSALYQKAEQLLGSAVTRKLANLSTDSSFGGSNAGQKSLLSQQAFASQLAPPLPNKFRKFAHTVSHEEHRAAVQNTLANKLSLGASELQNLDLSHYYGPFLRCYDVIVPEWVPIFEIPDISFRVTQDVDGNGTQDVIYSSGLFDVPWNNGPISPVTLVASPIAISTTQCNVPVVPCGNVPSLEFVGLMPLVNPAFPAAPYVNLTTGFATRPNPPHPDGTIGGLATPPSTAPYTQTLQLYGCNQVDNAVYYRLRYTYKAPGSNVTSALAAFKGLTWPLYRVVGGNLQSLWPVSDGNGWYPVLASSDDWFPNNLMLEWDTTGNADGLYTVQLEIADGSKNLLATSSAVGLMIDNSVPVVTYSGIWSLAPDMSNSHPLPTDDCVVIDRGVTPANIYVQVSYSVLANHLRSVQVGSGGCAGGAVLTSALSTTQHWYEDAGDNSFSNVASYVIPSTSPQGVYSFDVYAVSRAFNPAGSDAGPLDDWNYNPDYRHTNPSFAIAVVNA